MLRAFDTAIVLQEVPNEITLAVSITGCSHRCEGCHSKYLWNGETGIPILPHLNIWMEPYKKYITCVCFLGGDQDQEELIKLCEIVHQAGLKTCLYTGYDSMSDLITPLLNELDYVKIGRYIQEKGPLNDPKTNQRFYQKGQDVSWIDVTDRFWTKYAEEKD